MASKFFVRDATGLVRSLSAMDAMMINLVAIGVMFSFTNLIFAASLYPGANIIYTSLIALIMCLPYAALYVLFSVSMPRSGGDYVWVSRTLNPALGFLANFYLTLIILSFSGITTGWAFTYAFAPMFQGIFQITQNSQYSALASFFSNNTYAFLSSVAVAIISGYLIFRGTRGFVIFQWVTCLASVVGAVVFIIVAFSADPATVATNFTNLSGAAYSSILPTAAANGITTSYSTTGTLYGSVFSTLTLIAFMYSAYFAGEVKGVNKSQITAQFGSLMLAGILQILVAASLIHAFGADFISALSQLTLTSKYPLPIFPSAEYLISFISPNILVIAIVNICFALMVWGACGSYIFTSTRNIFSWSFDRIFPVKMSTMSEKYASPYIVVAFATVISIIYAYLNYFTAILTTVLSYSILGWWLGVIIVALAGIAFPFRRKDLFDNSPNIARMKIGGVPVISILGVILAAISVFIAYAVVSPAFVGVLNPSYVFAVIGLLLLGVVIYYVSYFYNKGHGIAVDQAYRQIPPE